MGPILVIKQQLTMGVALAKHTLADKALGVIAILWLAH